MTGDYVTDTSESFREKRKCQSLSIRWNEVGQRGLVHIEVALFIGQKKAELVGRGAASVSNICS